MIGNRILLGFTGRSEKFDLESKNIRGKCLFVDINLSADLEEVFDMIMKNPPKKLLIILPEFKERDFWWQFDSISGELLSISHDSDAFYVENHPAGFRMWDCWVGFFTEKQIQSASGKWSKKQNNFVFWGAVERCIPR